MIPTIALAVALVQGPTPLELADAYVQARERSPRAAAALALADAARLRVASSRRPPDPQLQLGIMNYALPGLRPMESLGMTQLQLMQMVPVGGKLHLSGRVVAARADAESERAD